MSRPDDLLEEGRAALADARWDTAKEAFAAVLEASDDPEAHDGLGLAAWFLGDIDGGIAERAIAAEAYGKAGRCNEAARISVWISNQHFLAGRTALSRGWLARAERAIAGSERCAGLGWVAVERARHADSVAVCIAQAELALAIAGETGDADLEVFALSLLGRSQIRAGHRMQGMTLLEEAMAAASAGRVRNFHTLGEAYCNLVMACTNAGEWQRAQEWCELIEAFADEREAMPLVGVCRTVHADVLVAFGRWEEAERALQQALATHATWIPQMAAGPVASLAELRVRQGRLAEAAQLLAEREEHPLALRALALLRVAEGRPQIAAALLERGLLVAGDDALRSAHLLLPLVDARLACGELEGARAAARELDELAEQSGIDLIRARADVAAARVARASGRDAEASEAARRALAAFSALGMPLDTAEARLELARALAGSSPDLAAEEARSAQAAFRQVGAGRSLDAAAAVLRELGAGTPGGPRGGGELTAREREVLDLLALGLTNAKIAQSLVISEKTAGHHVSRILMKLGVRNRAEAAAYAVRESVGSP